MACEPIRLKDGTVVLANVKPGMKLTEEDRRVLEEYAEFCRERRGQEQIRRNREQR
ncbi:MAG: hypothetical protein LAP40_23540 [Acidobacteriia bacterium]|nr:hypothetical protein [Terriglobia bacterium]